MKHIVLYLFIALGFIACTKSKEAKLSEIQEFEKSEKTGTSDGLAELAKLHESYGKEYEDETANNYLYAAAQYYFYENKNTEATPLLSEYISRDDSSERFRNAAINLAMLHGKATEFDKADELISEVLDKDLPTAAQWQDVIGLYE
ncbi:hypothetical protein OAD66_09665, partial [Bacteroidia bacterium]|nr:hypothetical protein [Bacteroidia bacterium]